MTMTLLPSATTATALAAINSIGTTTAGSVNAQETDVKKGKQLLHRDGIKQDQTAADLTNPVPSIIKKQSTAVMKPDVGILSNDFLKNKGREQLADKQFAIHRKKQAAVDVDVGILGNGRQRREQWQTSRANQHAISKVTGRSLQSEDELLYMIMCPKENGFRGVSWNYVYKLFNETDGYSLTCSCLSPTTCGPNLCECLEYADGDILQCMDPFKQLCEGTKYISGIPGPWSMEECLGSKYRALYYCSVLPCFFDGGSYYECQCNWYDRSCTETRNTHSCSISKCCQAQTDDEGREACILDDLNENYYDEIISKFSISDGEMIARFNECAFNSDSDKSIVQCYCYSFSYGRCVNLGVTRPDYCEAMDCCFGQTEDDARLDCFITRFRDGNTGRDFRDHRNTIQESCVASGRSSDQCRCDIQGLSSCVGVGNQNFNSDREPRCDLFQCCQLQTDDNDESRKDCLVQDDADEAQSRYIQCLKEWWSSTEESCVCEKSNTLCPFGHANDRHCELSSCCQEQTDDTGRRECIGNFTTSQPSSAPSETTPAEDSIDEAEASPTAATALPGTSSSSIATPLGAKSLSKARVLTVVSITVWLLLT